MPPLLSSILISAIYLVATLLCLLLMRRKDYTAISILPGVVYLAILYLIIDHMSIEAARAWARWGFFGLGLQIIILLFWKYFILGSRK